MRLTAESATPSSTIAAANKVRVLAFPSPPIACQSNDAEALGTQVVSLLPLGLDMLPRVSGISSHRGSVRHQVPGASFDH
jgi:hypothetical protein